MASPKLMASTFQSAGPIPQKKASWHALQLIAICVIVLSPVTKVEAFRASLPDKDPLDHGLYLPGQRNREHNPDELVEISSMFRTTKRAVEQIIDRAGKQYKCCVNLKGDKDTKLQDVTDEDWGVVPWGTLPESPDCSLFSVDRAACECMFGNGCVSFENKKANKGCLVKRSHIMDAMDLTSQQVDLMKSAVANPELPFHRSKQGEENPVVLEFRIQNMANSRTGFGFVGGESRCWRALDEEALQHRLDGNVLIRPDEGNLHCKSGSEDYDYSSMLDVPVHYGSRLAGVVHFEGFGRDVDGIIYWSYFCTASSKNGYSLNCRTRNKKHKEAKQAYTVIVTGGPTSNEPGSLPYDLPNGNPFAGY